MIHFVPRLRPMVGEEIRTQPRPVVGNLDVEGRIGGKGFHFAPGVVPIGELNGVGQQVDNNLFKAIKIPKNRRVAVFERDGKRDAVLVGKKL